MEIRSLRETDSRLEVSRIYEESWKAACRGIVPQAYLDGIPAGRWAEALDRAGWDTLVLAGGSGWPGWPGFGEVVSLYLLPESMGRGYGKVLLEAAVNHLAGQGFRDVLLWVLEENLRARRFYEKAGFVCSGDFMEDEIGGKPLREVLYWRHMIP
nr:GNAT family N-acetyltransferase [uncultured Oscillibacter sp.]